MPFRLAILGWPLLIATPCSAQGEELGLAVLLDRERGHCLLCHQVSQLTEHPQGRFQGNIGPDLSDVGNRLTQSQIRQRIADPLSSNPETIMPGYSRTNDLSQVGRQFEDRPILDPDELTAVTAYVAALKQSAQND